MKSKRMITGIIIGIVAAILWSVVFIRSLNSMAGLGVGICLGISFGISGSLILSKKDKTSDGTTSDFWRLKVMETDRTTKIEKTVKKGITFGSALAMVISYTTWKSVGWAIFHGLLSWVYVLYFVLRY